MINKRFNIVNQTASQLKKSKLANKHNLHIEIIKDMVKQKSYFIIRPAEGDGKMGFNTVLTPFSITNSSYNDIREVIREIVYCEKLIEKYDRLDFEVTIQQINFETGAWLIDRLYCGYL